MSELLGRSAGMVSLAVVPWVLIPAGIWLAEWEDATAPLVFAGLLSLVSSVLALGRARRFEVPESLGEVTSLCRARVKLSVFLATLGLVASGGGLPLLACAHMLAQVGR